MILELKDVKRNESVETYAKILISEKEIIGWIHIHSPYYENFDFFKF